MSFLTEALREPTARAVCEVNFLGVRQDAARPRPSARVPGRVRGTHEWRGGGDCAPGVAQLRQAIVTTLRSGSRRPCRTATCRQGTDCATLARYTATVLGGPCGSGGERGDREGVAASFGAGHASMAPDPSGPRSPATRLIGACDRLVQACAARAGSSTRGGTGYAPSLGHPPGCPGGGVLAARGVVPWVVENSASSISGSTRSPNPNGAVAEVEGGGPDHGDGRTYRQEYVLFLRAGAGRSRSSASYFDRLVRRTPVARPSQAANKAGG